MITLSIENRSEFITGFLGPISNLNDKCILKLSKDQITATLAAADSTIVCTASYPCLLNVDKNISLNIPDIKKLIRVLSIIPDKDFEITVNTNNISYSKNRYKFKFHLLDDGIIKIPSINIEKINTLEFDTTFNIHEKDLSTLFKGSAFTTETNKLYLYTEDSCILGELGDKSRHNTDNFICTVSESFNGKAVEKPLPINFETFRLISFTGSKEINFRINQKMGVICCKLSKGPTSLIYIISALIN